MVGLLLAKHLSHRARQQASSLHLQRLRLLGMLCVARNMGCYLILRQQGHAV